MNPYTGILRTTTTTTTTISHRQCNCKGLQTNINTGNKETKIWLRETTNTVSQLWCVPEIPGPIQMRPSRRASMSAESFVLFLKGADPKYAKNTQKPNF